MSCNFPQRAFLGRVLTSTGKRPLVFKRELSWSDSPELSLPCGRCTGCKLEWSRQWAVRCLHEKRMHAESAFITLTYGDETLPVLKTTGLATLMPEHFSRFMKRLRARRPNGVRFYGCGEYGDNNGRPHYHVLLFNTNFPDRKFVKDSKSGYRLFRSVELDNLWSENGVNFGHCWIGEVTFESCQYVAKYVVKKVNGDAAVDWYNGRVPEFGRCSLRPGIGYTWFEKYGDEAFAHDSIIYDAREAKIPRYYDKLRERFTSRSVYGFESSPALAVTKRKRREKALLRADDNTADRRRVKEELAVRKLQFFREVPK